MKLYENRIYLEGKISDTSQKNIFYQSTCGIGPLSPHIALKHHITSLKTDLIFLQLRVLE